MDLQVLPLFSFPLAVFDVEESFQNIMDSIDEMEFTNTTSSDENSVKNNYHTTDGKILESFPIQKNIILEYFYFYKNEVLGLTTTDFTITTSWITKTEPGGYAHRHSHTNCAYSGIFYFDSCEGGEIQFTNPFPNTFEFDCYGESNIFNSHVFSVKPEKNKLIFFPSQLSHKVCKNLSENVRYSLPFNIFPTGGFGNSDSSINIRVCELDNF